MAQARGGRRAGDGMREQSGYRLPTGTLEDAREMIGTRTPIRTAPLPVDRSAIIQFCALVHDGNASYWDPAFARTQWGDEVAPPAMLLTWLMPLEWAPGDQPPVPLLMAQVPLPGDSFVNASNEVELYRQVRVGDRLNVVEELTAVSDEKTTALGRGHFVTTTAEYRRDDGELVAHQTNVLFRFITGGPS